MFGEPNAIFCLIKLKASVLHLSGINFENDDFAMALPNFRGGD